MEQRDLIPDQIEQAAKVLAKLMADLIGYKSKGMFSTGIEQTRMEMIAELDVDPILIISTKELSQINDKGFAKLSEGHLEILSQYVEEIGENYIFTDKMKAIRCFEKSIELLRRADQISGTLSFVRENKIKRLENKLNTYS